MHGAIPPFPQYAFMAWCLVKHKDTFIIYQIFRVSNSRRMKWEGHVAHMKEMRNAYKILVGRPRHGWRISK
jgi:hypothetical protein